MYLQVFLLTAILGYIILGLYKLRQSIKWADNVPGRHDWFFYNLIFKVQGVSPESKIFFLFRCKY